MRTGDDDAGMVDEDEVEPDERAEMRECGTRGMGSGSRSQSFLNSCRWMAGILSVVVGLRGDADADLCVTSSFSSKWSEIPETDSGADEKDVCESG